MNPPTDSAVEPPVPPSTGEVRDWKWVRSSALWALGAAGCFHLAYSSPILSVFILGYAFCLVQLARAQSTRVAFYCGLGAGLLVAAPQLSFFFTIFTFAAIPLWLLLAIWIGLFCALARASYTRFGSAACLLIPMLWTGLEYFRSELYFLKFSWLNIGYVLAGIPSSTFLKVGGMYGAGFCAMFLAVYFSGLPSPQMRRLMSRMLGTVLVIIVVSTLWSLVGFEVRKPRRSLWVTGVQVEFPATFEVVADLNKALSKYPDTDLFMLSEYTFDGPVPPEVTSWCKAHQKYLIAGGKDAAGNNFYNTAFVIGTNGNVVFSQVKSVPIQFFKDGLPAPRQELWDSPWGKLGVCICYDLSYTRVTDRLVEMGARGLLCPTMDVLDWGRHQHALHALVTPVRAAEYGIPIFRVASSGVSQFVDHKGKVEASAQFGQQHAILNARMTLGAGGRPLDRWLAPLCVAGSLVVVFLLIVPRRKRAAAIGEGEV